MRCVQKSHPTGYFNPAEKQIVVDTLMLLPWTSTTESADFERKCNLLGKRGQRERVQASQAQLCQGQSLPLPVSHQPRGQVHLSLQVRTEHFKAEKAMKTCAFVVA